MRWAIYAKSKLGYWTGYYDDENAQEAVATFSDEADAHRYIENSKLKRYSRSRMSWYRANSLLDGYVEAEVAPYAPKHPPHNPKL